MFFGLKKFHVIILCSIVLISTGAGTYIQFIKGDLFQAAIDNRVNELLLLITLFLVSVITELLFYYIEWKFENKLYSQFVNNTKKSISKSILSTNHFDTFDDTKNSAINILNNKIDRLEFQYYKSLFDNTYLFFKIILVSISLFYINILVAMVVLVFLFIPLIVTKAFKDTMSYREKKYQDYKGKNLNLYENFFSNLKSIKMFELRSILQEKLENSIDKEVDQYKYVQNLKISSNIINSSLSYSSHILVLIVSVFLVINGEIESGMVLTLLGLVDQLSMPILVFSRNLNNINSTKSIRDEIVALLENTQNYLISNRLNDNLTTKSISFKTKTNFIKYKDLVLDVNKNYLFEGTSGIGKSLLIDILLNNKIDFSGDIFIDGKKAEKNDFIENIGYIETSNLLIEGSVKFNILFTEQFSDNEMNLAKSLLSDQVLKNETTVNLSSGEKRRVLLLRGLLSNKDLIVFDEPTANLDTKSALIFWDLLKKCSDTKKYIVISHNTPNAIRKWFDEIIDFSDITERL